MTDQRRANLHATLDFLQVKPTEPELRLLYRVCDTWTGIGRITAGVERKGLRRSLSHIAEGEWRAQLHADPMVAPSGYGLATTLWRAVRHTFASRLVMAGVGLLTVKELGGWRTLAMVQRCAHLAPGHLHAAVERLTRLRRRAGWCTLTA